MMVEPIIKKKTVDAKEQVSGISKETYTNIIKSVHDIMIDYVYMQKTFITKSHPISMGNVIFWFETDENTQESYLKYDRNVISWNQEAILNDIDLHRHTLYYTPPKQ